VCALINVPNANGPSNRSSNFFNTLLHLKYIQVFLMKAYDLKHHVESIHNGIRPHQCEECGKEFTRKYTLQLHQKIHNGNKSHKCDVCQKGFITKSKLIEHRRIHTGWKFLKVLFCAAEKFSLLIKGERPFLCDYCGRSFRIKFDMMTHKQKAHVGVDLPKKDKLGSQSANEPVFSAEDQEVEDDAPETDSVITHYVQLKEGEVSMVRVFYLLLLSS